QIGVRIASQGNAHIFVGLNRSRRDFRTNERQLIEWISPHIACAWRHARTIAELQQRQPDGCGQDRQQILVVNLETGRIEITGPATASLLSKYTGLPRHAGDLLEDGLWRWLIHHCELRKSDDAMGTVAPSTELRRNGSRLIVRLAQSGPTTAILLLEEQADAPAAPPPARLTRRESEILHWIGEGKRNSEIGTILGISSRTVEKPVEHLLEKLGVETRTAAMRLEWERREAT